jgi:monoterpene epsilon-lactone hydrolase
VPSEAYQNLVTMLSAGRVTPEIPIDQTRGGWDAMETMLPTAPDVAIEDTTVAGRPARWLTPPGAGGTTVIHLHGGGYVIGSCRSHTPFASHLAASLGARVLLLDYRLAPEHPAPAAIDDVVAAYTWLIEAGADPSDIVFTGDSAGGGLAVASLVQLRDAMQPLPAAVALISPWTNMTGGYDSMRTKADEDIILSPELIAYWGGLYAGELLPSDARLSPCLGDLDGLPPIHIQVGTREILLDDAREFADNASGAGVDVTLEVCDEMIHIWPVLGAGIVPEAQEAIDRIVAFVNR